MCRCWSPTTQLLGIGQMVGEIICREKCLSLSHRHWIPIALNPVVELFGISAFYIGISAYFVITLLLFRYLYCCEVHSTDIYRRHYLITRLLFFWLLEYFAFSSTFSQGLGYRSNVEDLSVGAGQPTTTYSLYFDQLQIFAILSISCKNVYLMRSCNYTYMWK